MDLGLRKAFWERLASVDIAAEAMPDENGLESKWAG